MTKTMIVISTYDRGGHKGIKPRWSYGHMAIAVIRAYYCDGHI
jgi:hypothetical protein